MLAFEFSTREASLALLDGGEALAEECWTEPRARHLHWRPALERLLSRSGATLRDIDSFAVGRGPGAFSGVRIAITAANALALPRELPVHAVTSGEALAARGLSEHAAAAVAVVGDARRGAYWHNLFRRDGGSGPWLLSDEGGVAAALAGADLVLTPEWERVGPILSRAGLPAPAVSTCPRAAGVGRLVRARLARGIPCDPLTPLYLHPAVS